VVRATLEYRHAEDVFARFKAEVGLEFNRALKVPRPILTERYAEWTRVEGIDPAGPREFRGWLEDNGARLQRLRGPGGGREYYWVGVGFDGEENDDDAIPF
jgi:hypothetical protein